MVDKRMIGIQLGPVSVYDEGVDKCLDIISNEGGANTLFVYAENYYGAHNRPLSAFADHGVPLKDERKRNLTKSWAKKEDLFLKNTILKPFEDKSSEYSGNDIFETLKEPCQKRDLKIYARILGFYGTDHNVDSIANFPKVLGIDPFGVTGRHVCFRNEDFINYTIGTAESLLKTHPYIEGLQFGYEIGSMMNRLLRSGWPSVCFCDKCISDAKIQGIDADRAAKGWRELTLWCEKLRQNKISEPDGIMIGLLKQLIKYPEILAWDKFQTTSIMQIYQRLYGTVKAINPEIDFGLHIDHQQSSWDPWFRAMVDYREMSSYCDFIKPILYHQVLSPRLRRWYYDEIHKTWMKEISLEMFMGIFADIFGYKDSIPNVHEMDTSEFNSTYVYSEIKRIKAAVGSKARAIAGIGVDVMYGGKPYNPNPNSIGEAIKAASNAGGEGILLSREYGEMSIKSLNQARDTMKEIGWI